MSAYTHLGLTTNYRGVKMRSRLEVRWAIFFTRLGLDWDYEPQKFSLPSGVYVPDFRVQWTSGHALWIEVKPSRNVIRPIDWARYREFRGVGRVLLLCDGVPAPRPYPYADEAAQPGSGVLLLATGPQFCLDSSGKPFDTTSTRRACGAATQATFRRL